MTDTPDVPEGTVEPAPPSTSVLATTSNGSKGASKKSVAIGAAAVGIGSAAIVAALLYTRRR